MTRLNPKLIPEIMLRKMDSEQRKALGKPGMLSEELHAKQVEKAEKEIHDFICAMLDRNGIFYFHQRMDRKSRGKVGTPDFMFCLNGKPIAWEAKMPGEVLSPEQEEVRVVMVRNGWNYSVIYSGKDARDEAARISSS